MKKILIPIIVLLMLSTLMLVTNLIVLAIPSCGSHFFTKVSYTDNKSTPEEAERTSIFTTEDDVAFCRLYEPKDWYGIQFEFYDPYGNEVPGHGSVSCTYEDGVAYCVEAAFNISGYDRELGQYRVEVSAQESEFEFDYHHLFTDYFQICMYPCFQVNLEGDIFKVPVLSNSTVTGFNFNETEEKIIFDVSGTNGTWGFCNVTITNALFAAPPEEWKVLVDNKEVDASITYINATHTSLYFTYIHSTHNVTIIPEFPSFLILPLFLTATLLALVFRKRLYRRVK